MCQWVGVYYKTHQQNSRRAQGIGIPFTQLSCTWRRTSVAAELHVRGSTLHRQVSQQAHEMEGRQGEDMKHSVRREWRVNNINYIRQHVHGMSCLEYYSVHFRAYMDIGAAVGNGVSCIDHKLHFPVWCNVLCIPLARAYHNVHA